MKTCTPNSLCLKLTPNILIKKGNESKRYLEFEETFDIMNEIYIYPANITGGTVELSNMYKFFQSGV